MSHHEIHRTQRAGWLRASVLGANDGIVSTASLIIGFTAAQASHETILLSGMAGLVAGAMSMAAGEYVSVSSQADIEKSDLAIEKKSIEDDFDGELLELAEIYERRGLDAPLAKKVAGQLMAYDALAAHARDEIGISSNATAKPLQAAISSALSFVIGALLPLCVVWFFYSENLLPTMIVSTLLFLAFLGGLSAKVGGAPMTLAICRVVFWGALAMGVTALVGRFFGVSV